MTTVYNLNTPPIKGSAFTFYISLVSQADNNIIKTTPTLAAGDVTISKDGGNYANIGTLPTQVQTTGVLSVAATSDEMNANQVTLLFHDVSGAEWQDALINIFTVSEASVSSFVSSSDAVILAANAIDASNLTSDAGAEIATEVWASGARTLTQSAAAVTAAVTGSNITIRRGDTVVIALTDVGSLANRSALYWTVKDKKSRGDSDAILQVEETAGLLRLNGAVASTSDGTLVVDDVATGDITITLTPVATAALSVADDLFYDVQIVRSVGTPVSTLTEAYVDVVDDVTKVTT